MTISEFLNKKIEVTRIYNCVYTFVDSHRTLSFDDSYLQLTKIPDDEFLKTPNFGKQALIDFHEILYADKLDLKKRKQIFRQIAILDKEKKELWHAFREKQVQVNALEKELNDMFRVGG